MDYVEAFKNLKTNNKYGRKSPHKAVLMLTVIELYEQNILSDNEIFYDEKFFIQMHICLFGIYKAIVFGISFPKEVKKIFYH